MNACVHTDTNPQISSTRSRGLGWRIHGSVEDTKLSTNKQHTLSPRTSVLLQTWDARHFRARLRDGVESDEWCQCPLTGCSTLTWAIWQAPWSHDIVCKRAMLRNGPLQQMRDNDGAPDQWPQQVRGECVFVTFRHA